MPLNDTPSTSSIPFEDERKGIRDTPKKMGRASKQIIINNVKTTLEARTSLLIASRYNSKSLFPITIYKVPEKLRKGNEDSFMPRIVSIGPHHKGTSHLQPMEALKVRCLLRFNKKYEDASIQILTEMVEREDEIRNCYEQSLKHLGSEEFIEMMMLDGIFILELLSETSAGAAPITKPGRSTSNVDEKLFEQKWMMDEILHDMLLLENQLPWFVISLCLRHAKPRIKGGEAIVEMHLEMFFEHLAALKLYLERVGITCPPKAMLEHTVYSHFLDIVWTALEPKCRPKRPRNRGKPEYTRTATELLEAGVQIKKGGEGKTITEIEFDFTSGNLTIPTLIVNEWTETLFRNLIALEQCQHGSKHRFVTSYIIFLDYLIETSDDVKLLEKCRIIDNSLGDSQKVADLFNNLHKETLLENKGFHYAKHCEELNEYSRDFVYQCIAKCQKWKRMFLSDDYFGNPLSATAAIVAFLLLILTVIQAVCSVKALHQGSLDENDSSKDMLVRDEVKRHPLRKESSHIPDDWGSTCWDTNSVY